MLGIKWLEQENLDIDWSQCTLTFPVPTPEIDNIAQEEEADANPLEGIPPQYHPFAKVFGKEEFNKLPPHQFYDIKIELTEEGLLNSPFVVDTTHTRDLNPIFSILNGLNSFSFSVT
ncbi:hypothetical protein RSOLAG1IB_07963 [Rhizoctonia solani AG-1 IB]|uniref:Uncharacterized protein n=1 Tax=Thanatephorus cucumeris (strain AG1-IB / isolate 7/3/14) TaxID=1108050 RepID=A0A0B7FKG4_THACB|nr:hypothetical protein RSOLAG1IB_07963 [Rhizoctonia solani AG-1 IB]